jgi:hypothetical protein
MHAGVVVMGAWRRALIGLVAVAIGAWVAPAAAAAPGAPTLPAEPVVISSISPPTARPGDVVEVRGRGFSAHAVTVTVAGVPAAVHGATGNRLEFTVPSLSPGPAAVRVATVVGFAANAEIEVLAASAAYDGTVTPRLDHARAVSASLGAQGGVLAVTRVDGTGDEYSLVVPAGALDATVTVTMTPLVAIDRLPLAAGLWAGVHLEPSGLGFATPAVLHLAGPPPPMAADARLSGFTYHGAGEGLTLTGPADAGPGDAGPVTVPVAHFSGAGAVVVAPSDFDTIAAALIASLGTMTVGEIRSLLDIVAAYQSLFGAEFCASRPVCDQAIAKAFVDVDVRFVELCAQIAAMNRPTYSGIAAIFDVAGLRAELGHEDAMGSCLEPVITKIIAVAGKQADDAGPFAVYDSSTTDARHNLNMLLFAYEQAVLISGLLISTAAWDRIEVTMVNYLDRLVSACKTNAADTRPKFADAIDAADFLVLTVLEGFVRAEADCVVRVVIDPTAVELAVGDIQGFVATVFGVEDDDVTWTATGGTVVAGSFTADTAGTHTVTATSVTDPAASATATVTVVDRVGWRVRYTSFIGCTTSDFVNDCFVHYDDPDERDVLPFHGEAGPFRFSVSATADNTAVLAGDFPASITQRALVELEITVDHQTTMVITPTAAYLAIPTPDSGLRVLFACIETPCSYQEQTVGVWSHGQGATAVSIAVAAGVARIVLGVDFTALSSPPTPAYSGELLRVSLNT